MTIGPRRGEIWSCRLPGKADDPHQPRPALVISADARNDVADDLIVIPIFSRGAIGPTHVALPHGEGGIRKSSVLFCEEVTTIDSQFIARGPWGARISDVRLDAVVRGVRRSIGETVPEPEAT
jgi:mRNA-degrading endonuclease toxin of MazEF toxin-antitoxin module